MSAEVTSQPGQLVPGTRNEPVPPITDRPGRRDLPARPGMRWLAGDLHTHTVHSDGVLTVPELARFAVERGLDFLAVTDHNTISHHAELPAAAAAHGITLLPGQEVTTDQGHANALGDIGWVDFREPPDDWLATTERAGGLLSVNHPYRRSGELDRADDDGGRRCWRSGTGAGWTRTGRRRWPGGWCSWKPACSACSFRSTCSCSSSSGKSG